MTQWTDEATFETERPRLVGLAYRITGSWAEADDIVQDAWLRWHGADQGAIATPPAWLTTVTSRLALDRLKAARHQREAYVGPWLPEPVDPGPGPEEAAELAESLTIGFLAVLERLGPTERVVFLLADVFAVPYDEIAEVVDRSVEACRQVASRARRRIREDRPRFAPTDERAWEVAMSFMACAQDGDLDAIASLLSDDAVLISDGGPHHRASRRPVVGGRIPRLLTNLAARDIRETDEISICAINGQPGSVVRRDGQPLLAVAVAIDDGLVDRIWIVVNPEKLAAL